MLTALAQTTPPADAAPSLAGPTVALALGGAGLYVAARVGAHALVGPRGLGEAPPGTIALGLWMPIAATALMAVLTGPSGDPLGATVAVGVLFATTVAALSLAVGMTALLVPNEAAGPTRRAWPFLLPAGLLAWLAGFGGGLNPLHALMVGLLGVAVRGVWTSRADTAAADEPEPVHTPPTAAPPLAYAGPATTPATGPPWPRVALWMTACAVAIVAGWAAVRGTAELSLTSRLFGATLVAAGGLGPLLTLPSLAVGTDMAQRGRAGDACSVCAGVALLNLFALLPALVFFWWARQALAGTAWPAVPIAFPDKLGLYGALSHFVTHLPSLPMPTIVWRVDTVVVTVLGFALLPAATGRARLGRLEAVTLVGAYAAYLAAVAYLATRPGGA